ncbi:MAG: ester cyclase [Chloroflexi bacterium]|nr:ester cyclase [Chloroflexota bacterium]
MSSVTDRNKEIVLAALERSALGGSPQPGAQDPYLESCIFHGAAEMFRGVRPDRDYVQAFPDLRFELEDVVAESDRVVTRLVGRGTHRGEFRGVQPTGRLVVLHVIAISRLADERIVEEWGTLSWE